MCISNCSCSKLDKYNQEFLVFYNSATKLVFCNISRNYTKQKDAYKAEYKSRKGKAEDAGADVAKICSLPAPLYCGFRVLSCEFTGWCVNAGQKSRMMAV